MSTLNLFCQQEQKVLTTLLNTESILTLLKLQNNFDWRLSENRLTGALLFHKISILIGETESYVYFIKEIAKQYHLKQTEIVYFCFLFQLVYNTPTAWVIYSKLGKKYSLKQIQKFFDSYKDKLIFQTDRRWIQWCNRFVDIMMAFSKIDLELFLSNLTDDGRLNAKFFYFYFKNIPYLTSRFGTFLFLECIQNIFGKPFDVKLNLTDSSAETERGAIALIYNLDKQFETKNYNYKQLTENLNHFVELCKKIYKKSNIFNIETNLCAYVKLFKQTRYLGYYIDRNLEELVFLQPLHKDVDFDIFFETRKKLIPKQFLGEYNGWNGIRPQLKKYFMTTGRFYPFVI